MPSQLGAWSVLSLVLGVALVFTASTLPSGGDMPDHERPAVTIIEVSGWVLAGLAIAGGVLGRMTRRRDGSAPPVAPVVESRPYVTLFVISFVALFVELALIRYSASQVRIFSFYKNVPLIASFLGLGLGCCLARGTVDHALRFVLWLVPLSVFLSAGSLGVSHVLGKHAAIASTEHILGDFIPSEAEASDPLLSQILVAAFCVAAFVVITVLFVWLGRLMGDAFERVERLPGYTANITGSLAGILGFVAVSYLEQPPWVWLAVGLLPLTWWCGRRRERAALVALIVLCCAAVFPSYGDTVWSRYQKLVGHRLPPPGGTLEISHSYLVEISDVFYQRAVDRSPMTLVRTGISPYPHYDALYARLPKPDSVMIVGAGSGNDVAAALRAGAQRVVAVDIDPAILSMGREHHPERPYSDPRVDIVVDDARHAFRHQPPASFDAVVFGLLDSHTQLGMSSVRLDNYVFTRESLAEAARLVKPGGHLIISAATFEDWFGARLVAMLGATVGGEIESFREGAWVTHIGRVVEAPGAGSATSGAGGPAVRAADGGAPPVLVPTDDWPFLYLPERGVPAAYLWVVACLFVAALVVFRVQGLSFGAFTGQHAHLFCLGAAFLLMEVHAINRLALLFGTTWLVSAVTIAVVLMLIVAANVTVAAFGRIPYGLAYGALAASLAVSFLVEPAAVLGAGAGKALAFSVLLLSPVYFAGLIFARSFRAATVAAPAIGANILGSVVGGWLEYSTMALGVRALVLLAFALYGLSLVFLITSRPREPATG